MSSMKKLNRTVRLNATVSAPARTECENDEWEVAHCRFLASALLKRKAEAEVEKKRHIMKQCVSNAVDSIDKLSRKSTKLRSEKNKLDRDCDLEDSIDYQMTVLKGPLSLSELRKSVHNLGQAAKTSAACMTSKKVYLPKNQAGQEALESELKDISTLLVDFNSTTDHVNIIRASTSSQQIDTCLKREGEAITKLGTLVTDIKALAEENALMVSCESCSRRCV